MCGITGVYNLENKRPIDKSVLSRMTDSLYHRGPDDFAIEVNDHVGFGFRRLSIIDLETGQQPFRNNETDVTMICNGEIYNYLELRAILEKKGYAFRSNCDVEVILPMYLEYGTEFIQKLNGQFAFAIYDGRDNSMLLARDHFGICPLFIAVVEGKLLFGSECKAILEYPGFIREVNLKGLDQTFSFPGMLSPTTMFRGIESVKPGHYVKVLNEKISTYEYWDLIYPKEEDKIEIKPESYYIDGLEERLLNSVKYRLNADVPVGFYLSGGLDSSLVGAMMHKTRPREQFSSFSIGFPAVFDKEYDERTFQRLMARKLKSIHSEIEFDWSQVDERLRDAIKHSECPLKETYNTCSLALSEAVNKNGIKVILSGEGSDELLGGYVGYRFDTQRQIINDTLDLEEMLEQQTRNRLWGDPHFFYEKNQHEFRDTLKTLFSDEVVSRYDEISAINDLAINKDRLRGRHVFHKRSYLDLKLRLSDHLISDHCDRVAYANSVEGRYPFLDVNLVDFLTQIPPGIKLKGLVEKYLLKEVAKRYVPAEITNRQKFSFVAPGSSQLLKNNIEWVNDLLSYNQIKRQGYFNPGTIERIKKLYKRNNFKLNLPFDDDLLIVVLTFNIFLEEFDMPSFNGQPYYSEAVV